MIRIRFHSAKIDGSGPIRWRAEVQGRVAKKDGTPGAVTAEHEFFSESDGYSGRISAIKTRNDVTAHMRKLLGLDAAEKHEIAGAVRCELVGVDPDDLS